ncbi:hypothetical protein L9F63_003379, partial [Diploptera punctata]
FTGIQILLFKDMSRPRMKNLTTWDKSFTKFKSKYNNLDGKNNKNERYRAYSRPGHLTIQCEITSLCYISTTQHRRGALREVGC